MVQPLQDVEDIDALITNLSTSLLNLRRALITKANIFIDFNSLDARTRNVLINYHIEDYLALSECEAQTIIKWRWCGKKTIQNIIKLMDTFSCGTVIEEFETNALPDFKDRPRYYTTTSVQDIIDKKYYTGTNYQKKRLID